MLGFSEENISLKFRERRIEMGLSQTDLARASGLPLRTVQDFEAGKREPRLSTLMKLGRALNVRPMDLWGGNEAPSKSAILGPLKPDDVALVFSRLQTATPAQRAIVLTVLFEDPSFLDDFELPENFVPLFLRLAKSQ